GEVGWWWVVTSAAVGGSGGVMKVLGWPTWVVVAEATMVVMDDGSGSGGGHDG
ncbi:hypothetical protein Tco_1120250, partial [Tanacetum coccineum]